MMVCRARTPAASLVAAAGAGRWCASAAPCRLPPAARKFPGPDARLQLAALGKLQGAALPRARPFQARGGAGALWAACGREQWQGVEARLMATVQGSSTQGTAAMEKADVLCEACTGTVDLYHQHIFIFTGDEPWPPKVGDPVSGIPIVSKMAAAVKQLENDGSNSGVLFKVGAIQGRFDEDGSAPQKEGIYDVLLFPSALRFEVKEDEVDELLASFMSFSKPFQSLHTLAPPPDGRIAGQPLPQDLHLFVCVHGSRDARCGDIGPKLASSLESLSAELDLGGEVGDSDDDWSEKMRVYKCSHLGGHRWAGNLVVYPQGDWYGNLGAEVPRAVLEEIVSGQVLSLKP